MQDDVTYSMAMFHEIENLVNMAKLLGFSYEEALSDIANVAMQRAESGMMDSATAEYDSSNIMATFNIIWGE